MSGAPIRNIVFDVGNVIVPWDPVGIEERAFGADRLEDEDYRSPFRWNTVWLAINRGELSLEDARTHYAAQYGFATGEIDRVYEELFASFPLLHDTRDMMDELKASGYRLFAITDNVHEIVAYLKEAHDFWPLFEVAAVSAEIGALKPDPRIYRWLIEKAGIDASECVFLDDVDRNVAGAKAVGMQAFQFTDAASARRDLQTLGVEIGTL